VELVVSLMEALVEWEELQLERVVLEAQEV
jgi:hypothetical protein